MTRALDLIGEHFDRLEVVSRGENTKQGKTQWLCRCTCGETKTIRAGDLLSERTKSCGCLNKELPQARRVTHRQSYSRLYRIWQGMKRRCTNEKVVDYKYYGGRGIDVCDEWFSNFALFSNWAKANGYNEELTIDRKNNDKGYSPDNCRWATMKEQSNNKRNNLKVS